MRQHRLTHEKRRPDSCYAPHTKQKYDNQSLRFYQRKLLFGNIKMRFVAIVLYHIIFCLSKVFTKKFHSIIYVASKGKIMLYFPNVLW